MSGRFEVALRSYRVLIARGALGELKTVVAAAAPAHRYAVITDATVGPLHLPRVIAALAPTRVDVFTIPPGETHKTRATWASLTDEMLAAGLGRDTTVIALGGGVIGDLAGFVAATYMRGVPVVQVPTTLLAMIDASIGGKTGVDTPAGKNLVGAFHQPAAVIADPDTLATLPREQLRAGLAEALKHGVIADAAYFERVSAAAPAIIGGDHRELPSIVARSVEIKADVVGRDEKEAGLRKVLNFGHTLGHAIEALSGYTLLHGEAVAIGMALESAVAERAGVAERDTARRVRDAAVRAGLPVTRPRTMEPARIVDLARGDKKARAGVVEYALPRCVGAMAGEKTGWGVRVEESLVREVLA